MKITFLVPPILQGTRIAERVAGCSYVLYDVPNIFMVLFAAVARDAGHEVSYVDFPVMKKRRDDFLNFLKNDDSHVYFIFTVELSVQTDILAHQLIRQTRGNIPLIFAGPAPSHRPETFLKDAYTYIVRGEPERTMIELLVTLDTKGDFSQVKGLSFIKDREVVHNLPRELIKNLDDLPFPARDLVDKSKGMYFNPKLRIRPVTLVLGSRNCSYRCIYCVPCALTFAIEIEYKRYFKKKPPVRLRSAQNIISEFNLLKKQGYKAVVFQDDIFIWEKQRTIEFCRGIKNVGIVWGCQARADHLSEDLLKEMAQSGCRYIDIGIESFNQEILDAVRKDLKVEDSIRAIKLIKKYGIDAKINIIFGATPLETKKTINHTRKMVKKLKVSQVMYSACAPWPGTELYDIAKKQGWFVDGDYRPSDGDRESIIQFPHLSNLY